MIKVFKVICKKDLSYEKTEFINKELHFAFVTGNQITVVNGANRRHFCDMNKCMYLHGHPYGFQKYFDILDILYVENKRQLRDLIMNGEIK